MWLISSSWCVDVMTATPLILFFFEYVLHFFGWLQAAAVWTNKPLTVVRWTVGENSWAYGPVPVASKPHLCANESAWKWTLRWWSAHSFPFDPFVTTAPAIGVSPTSSYSVRLSGISINRVYIYPHRSVCVLLSYLLSVLNDLLYYAWVKKNICNINLCSVSCNLFIMSAKPHLESVLNCLTTTSIHLGI